MIKSKIFNKPLMVVIDNGHGGIDPGASGNKIIEKVANLTTGLALGKYLAERGAIVKYTRNSDKTVSLEKRVKFANELYEKYKNKYVIIFISVHHNAGGGDRGEYIHSIVMGDSLELAKDIGGTMKKELKQQEKIYSKKGSDNKDYYYVIKYTRMPAVIVEVAFLDNKEDVKICDTSQEQRRNGEVIARGVLNWYGYVEEVKKKVTKYYLKSDQLTKIIKGKDIKVNCIKELPGNCYIDNRMCIRTGYLSKKEAEKFRDKHKEFKFKLKSKQV